MIEIIKKKLGFTLKQIWFADGPHEVNGVSRVIFRDCKKECAGFGCERFFTLTIDMDDNLDVIWKNMSEGNVRKPVKRAEKVGIIVKINQNYDEFYRLYRSLGENKKLKNLLKLGDIKKYAILFVAELKGKFLAGHGYLSDGRTMRSWAVASDRFGANKDYITTVANASKLLIWEAIKYAKLKGIKEFDFGGYIPKTDDPQKKGISEFKKSFGGKEAVRYVCKKDYSMLYKFFSKLINKIKK